MDVLVQEMYFLYHLKRSNFLMLRYKRLDIKKVHFKVKLKFMLANY